jgi:photosystem II stability/assembly factor-like uncharacterized protein
VAVEYGGQIYTSTDSGLTWTSRDSNRNWEGVASSADGTKLVAVEYGGQIYTSTDSGLTWTPRDSNRLWDAVASSADGTKLVAVEYGGQIYTSAPDWGQIATTAGTAGFLTGGQYSSVELQYIGNDQFLILDSSGALFVS